MIRFLAIFLIFLVISSSVEARLKERPSETCKNLDMTDSEAVLQCLKEDHKYDQVIRHLFDTRVSCTHIQDIVLKRYIVSTDPSLARQMDYKKKRGADNLPRPSCEIISEITQKIANVTPMWDACLGYEEAEDKLEHFKGCMIGYTQGYYRYKDTAPAISTLSSGYDCQRALSSYEGVFKYTHRIFFPEGGVGMYTPEGYEPLSCEQIDPWLLSLKDEKAKNDEILAEQKRMEYRAMRAYKDQKKAEAKEKAKQQSIRAENTRKMFEALDKSYDFSAEFDKQLDAVNTMEHPKDKIENKHIRRALIQEIQKLVPEETNEFAGLKGITKHTTGGFRGRIENVPAAPRIFYGVENAKIKDCNMKKLEARCTYTATFFTNVDHPGARPNDRQAMNALYGIFAGPRTVTFENVFKHDGKQWKAVLNEEQKKLILPPSPKPVDQNAEEKAKCDYMSALGIPMLC